MRGLVALGAAALLLVGCTSDPAPPATLPPLTSSPTPSPTPVPTPSGINATTPDGANAFIRAWFAELNRAFISRDSRALRELSSSDCETCANYWMLVDRLKADDQTVEGGDISLLFVEVPPLEGSGVVADAAFGRSASRRLDASGKVIATGAADERTVVQIALRHVEGRWRFHEMRLTSS